MITRLVRWPNGMLSIVTAEDEKDMAHQLMKEQVCTDEEMDSPHGLVIDMPKGFNFHFRLNDQAEFEFQKFTEEGMPTVERLYPHLAVVYRTGYKTKKAAIAAAKEAVAKEREGLKAKEREGLK